MEGEQFRRVLDMDEREELRELLIGSKSEHALRFQTRAVRMFGPAGGIMARQLLFWDTRGHDQEGWIYKSRREMQEETGLTRRNQERARRVLKGRGVLEEETRPVGQMRRQTMHYRLDLRRLLELLPDPENGELFWDDDGHLLDVPF